MNTPTHPEDGTGDVRFGGPANSSGWLQQLNFMYGMVLYQEMESVAEAAKVGSLIEEQRKELKC
ncbi:MAG: hypothetical protein AAGK14_10720 [Verrucomicrobiota bacterium]